MMGAPTLPSLGLPRCSGLLMVRRHSPCALALHEHVVSGKIKNKHLIRERQGLTVSGCQASRPMGNPELLGDRAAAPTADRSRVPKAPGLTPLVSSPSAAAPSRASARAWAAKGDHGGADTCLAGPAAFALAPAALAPAALAPAALAPAALSEVGRPAAWAASPRVGADPFPGSAAGRVDASWVPAGLGPFSCGGTGAPARGMLVLMLRRRGGAPCARPNEARFELKKHEGGLSGVLETKRWRSQLTTKPPRGKGTWFALTPPPPPRPRPRPRPPRPPILV